MFPYLQADLNSGRLDIEAAEGLLADFFISLNKDSDLYPGVQQGDNGQTLTLGGITPSGKDGTNELTWMALRVARDLSMIDPKINLRISARTELPLLELASELTRKGLGFPQFSNDDVVIPSLTAHGYDLEDARNYTVAACWEFIIPGKGMEVVNIGAVSLPHAVDQAIRAGLEHRETFESIQQRVRHNIQEQVNQRVEHYRKLFLPPAPYYSVLMEGCLSSGRDLSRGLKYNNFGIHGAASANAADALAAVKQFVFDDQSLQASKLLVALKTNFAGYEGLRQKLATQAPKVGNRDALADEMLVFLFDALAEACEKIKENGRGGKVRPGTGSAMYYVWLARGHEGMREPVVGATADGRHRGDFFSANLAPAPGVRADSPFRVFESFSKIDYRRIYNGGPVTVELSDTVFRNDEGIQKVALLVRSFVRLGGQQLQINSLNAMTLLAAREHPEQYPNLIVRVWGWSGYFCELAPEYQDHIIQRCLFSTVG
jgi:formate C-acetyltransferase